MLEQWDLWFPDAGATGLSFARCRVGADAAAGRVLVHAAPPRLDVTVRDEQAPWSRRDAACNGEHPAR